MPNSKRPAEWRDRLVAGIIGLLAGLWCLVMAEMDPLFLCIGFTTIGLGVGIFLRQTWAKVVTYIFTAFILYLNLVWHRLSSGDPFLLIPVIVLLPVSGFCLYSCILFNFPAIKRVVKEASVWTNTFDKR